jgi:hypothetical protein
MSEISRNVDIRKLLIIIFSVIGVTAIIIIITMIIRNVTSGG